MVCTDLLRISTINKRIRPLKKGSIVLYNAGVLNTKLKQFNKWRESLNVAKSNGRESDDYVQTDC